MGDLYRHRHKLDAAIAEYREAVALAPRDPAALLGLAASYLLSGQSEEAVTTAKLALETEPRDPKLNLLVAEAMAAEHQFGGAEPYLKAALASPPEVLPHVHALLGRALARNGQTREAIGELKLGLLSDDDGSVHYQLARLYRKAGNAAASAEAMNQAKAIEAARRQRADLAVQDASAAALSP